MTSPETALPTRLPLWGTLGRAYRSVRDHFDTLLWLAKPWLLLLLPFEIARSWWSHPGLQADSPSPAPAEPVLLDHLFDTAWPFLLLAPLSAIAVAWHRYLLKGDLPAVPRLSFESPILPYMGMAALFTALTYLPLLPFGIVPEIGDKFPALALAGLAGLVLVIAIVSRLSLALPAIAIDGPGRSLGEAWRTTRRHNWTLLFGSVLSALPAMAVSALSVALAKQLGRIPFAVIGGLLELVAMLLITIGVAFLSFAWRHFYAPSASDRA